MSLKAFFGFLPKKRPNKSHTPQLSKVLITVFLGGVWDTMALFGNGPGGCGSDHHQRDHICLSGCFVFALKSAFMFTACSGAWTLQSGYRDLNDAMLPRLCCHVLLCSLRRCRGPRSRSGRCYARKKDPANVRLTPPTHPLLEMIAKSGREPVRISCTSGTSGNCHA